MNKTHTSTNRMDRLIGSNYRICAFRDLPVTHQLAIAHHMAIDGCAWDVLFNDIAETNECGLLSALPDYIREYGDTTWGLLDIPVSEVKQAVLLDEEIKSEFSNWDDYAAWFTGRGDTPEHGHENRWPAILSNSNDETFQDGWHRLHSYIRAGHADIPCVFYPEQRHRKSSSSLKEQCFSIVSEIIEEDGPGCSVQIEYEGLSGQYGSEPNDPVWNEFLTALQDESIIRKGSEKVIPTLELRYFVPARPVVTAKDVTLERERTGLSIMECKRRLVGVVPAPALQQRWVDADGNEEWKPVPLVIGTSPNQAKSVDR